MSRNTGILGKLFGSDKGTAKPYVDAGFQLIPKIADSLNLTEWRVWQGKIPDYTPQELDAINKELASFQGLADSVASHEVAGGRMLFHPEAVAEIQPACAAKALERLAGFGWEFSRWNYHTSAHEAKEKSFLKTGRAAYQLI